MEPAGAIIARTSESSNVTPALDAERSVTVIEVETEPLPLLVSVNRAARELALVPRTVYKLIESGRLPAVMVSHKTAIRREDLLKFIEDLPDKETK